MIATEDVLTSVRDSLADIKVPRFFETERGYQGTLLGQLEGRLQLPTYAIVEQEYQKQADLHGLTIRPDIIIHEPFDPKRHRTRADGNVAVVELKLRATLAEALADFESLRAMLGVLRYRLGIFVNIGSAATYAEQVPDDIRGHVVCFAVVLADGIPQVSEQRAQARRRPLPRLFSS